MRQLVFGVLLGSALTGGLVISLGNQPSLKAELNPIVKPVGAFGNDGKVLSVPEVTVKLASTKPMSVAEAKVWIKLQEKITMGFAEETSLQEVINYIQTSTRDKTDFPDGLPIYLDPQGLQDADKTPASTVAINLKGMPLATTLRLALKQLDLVYWANSDGLIIITSSSDEELPVDSNKLILEEIGKLRSQMTTLRDAITISHGQTHQPEPNESPQNPAPAMQNRGGMR